MFFCPQNFYSFTFCNNGFWMALPSQKPVDLSQFFTVENNTSWCCWDELGTAINFGAVFLSYLSFSIIKCLSLVAVVTFGGPALFLLTFMSVSICFCKKSSNSWQFVFENSLLWINLYPHTNRYLLWFYHFVESTLKKIFENAQSFFYFLPTEGSFVLVKMRVPYKQ